MPERGELPEDVLFAYFTGIIDAATRGVPPVNSVSCRDVLGEVAALGFELTPFEFDEARRRALTSLSMKFDFQKPAGEI